MGLPKRRPNSFLTTTHRAKGDSDSRDSSGSATDLGDMHQQKQNNIAVQVRAGQKLGWKCFATTSLCHRLR